MIVGSDKELTELKDMVDAKKAQGVTALNGLQGSDQSALKANDAITAAGPSEKSCSALNSSLLSRSQNDTTLRQVNSALRMLGEYTPQTEAQLTTALNGMKGAITTITEPGVKACETAFPTAKPSGPGGR